MWDIVTNEVLFVGTRYSIHMKSFEIYSCSNTLAYHKKGFQAINKILIVDLMCLFTSIYLYVENELLPNDIVSQIAINRLMELKLLKLQITYYKGPSA